MTVIKSLSDNNGLVFDAILMIVTNVKEDLTNQRLQWELFKAGIYIKRNLMLQAISVMQSKGYLVKDEKENQNPEAPVRKAPPSAIIQP